MRAQVWKYYSEIVGSWPPSRPTFCCALRPQTRWCMCGDHWKFPTKTSNRQKVSTQNLWRLEIIPGPYGHVRNDLNYNFAFLKWNQSSMIKLHNMYKINYRQYCCQQFILQYLQFVVRYLLKYLMSKNRQNWS